MSSANMLIWNNTTTHISALVESRPHNGSRWNARVKMYAGKYSDLPDTALRNTPTLIQDYLLDMELGDYTGSG